MPRPGPAALNDLAAPAGTCHNCSAVLRGPFCSACGQQARALDPSLRELTRDITHELLDVDGRLPRSIRALFLAPGLLTREWFLGRRVPWVTPLRLYLIFSVAYFGVVALGGTHLKVKVTSGERETAAELQRLGFASEQEMRATLSQAQAVWMPRVNFALVPLFAGLVALVRRGSGRRYPQHLLFALHAHAAWFGVRAIAAAGMLVPPAIIGSVLDGLSTLYGIVYVAIAFRVAYGVTTRRAIRDTVIVLGIYWIGVVAATLAVVLPALFWHKSNGVPMLW
jgi:Protein of unknown function (DUF3667)